MKNDTTKQRGRCLLNTKAFAPCNNNGEKVDLCNHSQALVYIGPERPQWGVANDVYIYIHYWNPQRKIGVATHFLNLKKNVDISNIEKKKERIFLHRFPYSPLHTEKQTPL